MMKRYRSHALLSCIPLLYAVSVALAQPGSTPEAEEPKSALTLSEVDQPPHFTRKMDPLYPYGARRKGIQGSVTVKYTVTREGKVVQPAVLEGEPQGVFDESVLRSIRRWRFRPAIRDGKPVDVVIIATVEFAIRSSEETGESDETEDFGARVVAVTPKPRADAYDLSEVDKPPRAIERTDPMYPAAALEKGISGQVTLRFIVTKEGNVIEPSVIEGDPPNIFDSSALAAIRGWQFRPATKDGQPVDAIVIAPLAFSLLGGNQLGQPYDHRSMPYMLRRIYRKGYQHFNNGNYQKAMASFDKIVKRLPYNPDGYHGRGLTHRKLGKLDKAIEDFNRAIILDGRHGDVYLNRGLAYAELGKLKEAIEDFADFVNGDPNNPKGYVARAIVFDRMGERSKACRDLVKACELGNCEVLNRVRKGGLCK